MGVTALGEFWRPYGTTQPVGHLGDIMQSTDDLSGTKRHRKDGFALSRPACIDLLSSALWPLNYTTSPLGHHLAGDRSWDVSAFITM